jgi:NAD(P)H-flavin reductase
MKPVTPVGAAPSLPSASRHAAPKRAASHPPHPPLPAAARGPSPWVAHVVRIAAVRPEIDGVCSFDLVFRDPAVTTYAFRPGQFNMLGLPGIGEAAISIAADAEACAADAGLRHTFRAVGNVTHALARLGPGAELTLRGPFGSTWPLEALQGRDVIIAAGGLGLASVLSAILHVIRHRRDYGCVAVLHGAKRPADLLYPSDYDTWRAAGLDVFTIVDRAEVVDEQAPKTTPPASRWTGPVGFVPALFDALDVAPGETGLICCGPEPMMAAVVDRAVAEGIGPGDIWLSMERNMACAAGFCGLCQFGPSFVCKDGPVFRHDEIAPLLAVRHV